MFTTIISSHKIEFACGLKVNSAEKYICKQPFLCDHLSLTSYSPSLSLFPYESSYILQWEAWVYVNGMELNEENDISRLLWINVNFLSIQIPLDVLKTSNLPFHWLQWLWGWAEFKIKLSCSHFIELRRQEEINYADKHHGFHSENLLISDLFEHYESVNFKVY